MPQVITIQLPGAPGPPGPQGLPGPSTNLSIGTVSTGPSGSAASATVSGFSPNQVLNLVIPRGNTGDKGDPGITPTFVGGTVTTLAAGSNATMNLVGVGPNYTLNLSIPRGATGLTGPTNTLTIGTVTTAASGSSASATITGSAPAQTLNLVLPQGPKGDKGDPGPSGTAVGLPVGGTAGQVLAKVSSSDFDTSWITVSGGGTGGTDPDTLGRIGNLETEVNGATSSATSNKLAKRDANGVTAFNRVTLTTQSAASDAVRKDYVDTIGTRVTALEAGTTGNSNNVANTVVKRDGTGSSEFSRVYADNAPAAGNELTRKDYVDSLIPVVQAGTNVSVVSDTISGYPRYVISSTGGSGGTVFQSAMPGTIVFESFDGTTTNEKIASMNEFFRLAQGSGPTATVLFNAITYNFSTPIKLFSGMKLQAGAGIAAREYSRSTVFNWQGSSGTSMLIFPPEGQTGQSYPSDGSPRDITMVGIQFQGGSSTHFMPKGNPSDYIGKTLWYAQFHNCAWKSFNTVWWGSSTGSSISGISHFQGIGDTALWLGGSETSIFGHDAYSFVDSSVNPTSGKPFMRTNLAKSVIGKVMITSRQANYQLLIDGGHNLVVDQVAFDAQGSDPVYGAGVKVTGGDGITFSGCSFKGMATTPSSGAGGSTSNRAWVNITGGRNVTFVGCNFRREGSNTPATSYPLVYVGSGANEVKWGFNNYSAWAGAGAVVQQATSGKITALPDPQVSITTAA